MIDVQRLRSLVETEVGLCDAAAELVDGVDIDGWASDWPALADLIADAQE